MDWDWPVFWDKFGIFADIVGVVSFGISIPTFLAAHGARKAIIQHDEVKQYRDEIQYHIDTLKGWLQIISSGDDYGIELLTDIYQTLDTLTIQYSSVVKPFSKKIKQLQSTINEACEKSTIIGYNRRIIQKQLNIVIQHLEKEKKSI